MVMEFTEKNPRCFYALDEFPELKVLEGHYHDILEELKALRQNSDNGFWLDTFPHYLYPGSKNKWKVFTFRFFGIKHPLNCSLCPKTHEALSKIPGLVSADFSYLPANTRIKPHVGFTKMVLRAHLGLIIPKDCGIRVGDTSTTWEPGKVIVFDDSFEHEAWNNSDEDRFILMLDIANPRWEYTADEINRYKIDNLRDEFMLGMFPKEQWQHFLDIGEFDVFPAQLRSDVSGTR